MEDGAQFSSRRLGAGKCTIELFVVTRLLPSLLLLMFATDAHAQFTFVTNNGALTITGYTGPGGTVIIPNMTNGLPVTRIGEFSFYNCYSVANVTMGNRVIEIANLAFYACRSLTCVTIGNSVVSIGHHAFFGCSGLTSISIPDNITNIAWCTFYNCTSLTNITIGRSVTNIGIYAFYSCTNLTGVYFRGNAPSLGSSSVFPSDNNAIVHYLPGTAGWSNAFAGCPAVLWLPAIRTSDASFGVRTNQFGFDISWASNMNVVVDACTNLFNPTWTPLQTNMLTADTQYFNDPQWTNHPTRFYRLRWP